MKWLRRTFLVSLAPCSILAAFGQDGTQSMEQQMYQKLQRFIALADEETRGHMDCFLTGAVITVEKQKGSGEPRSGLANL